MPTSALPFDDIRHLLTLTPLAYDAGAAAGGSADARGLGRLAELAAFLASWRGANGPFAARPLIALFAARHGFAEEDARDARARMQAIAAANAPVNRLCARFDVGVRLFELALDHPTRDIAREAAFEEAACAATIAYGMEAIAGGADLLCVGALGGDAEVCAGAICCALFGGEAQDWAPERSGADALIARAVRLHCADGRDPLEILRRLGGRDIAAMVGAILAARMERVPVLLDGYAAAAAAAVLRALDVAALDHCLAADAAAAGPHRAALRRLGKAPLLEFGLDGGEGCGGALAIALLQASTISGG